MIYRENFQFRQNAFMKKDFSPSWVKTGEQSIIARIVVERLRVFCIQ